MVDDFYVGPAKLNPSSIKARLPKTRRVRKAAESDAPQSYTVYLDEQEIGSVKTNSFIFENLSAEYIRWVLSRFIKFPSRI